MPPIQGLGGVFLYANDANSLADWYSLHLGITFQNWGNVRGVIWPSADIEPAGRQSITTVAIFQTKEPLPAGVRTARINLRVSDLDALVASLRAAGLEVEAPEASEYGAFAWVSDPEGNRVELWQPPMDDAAG